MPVPSVLLDAETPSPQRAAPAVVFDHVSFGFDDHVVLQDITFAVPSGSMTVLLGASGSGKSVLLKLILGLLQPDTGAILVNGVSIGGLSERQLAPIRADIGMMFQENALFDSLTVAENVGYRLYEETDMPLDEVRARVEEVVGFVGLQTHIDKMPSELSGGERRRVAIARAMAARPRLVLLDDPTSGLDPITATTIDDQIIKLRDLEGVTSIVVTHQIRDAFYIAGHRAVDDPAAAPVVSSGNGAARFMVLDQGRICFEGSGTALRDSRDPFLREFLFRTLPPW
jgi:phospholipid/cholesterol/gamma-HCH transport system ATP-binding protein